MPTWGGTFRYGLYDLRRDRIGTVDRAGTITGRRMSDAWGVARPGSAPAGAGMVAGIGHVTDDEDGGMVYMRARWYEPTSGRFISEDPARDGGNWFSYCGGDPVNKVDFNGKESIQQAFLIALFASFMQGVGALIGGGLTGAGGYGSGVTGAFLITQAIAMFGRVLFGLMEHSMENVHTALERQDFVEKRTRKGLTGIIVGTALGVATAVIMGMYQGKLMTALFYIDNFECFVQ